MSTQIASFVIGNYRNSMAESDAQVLVAAATYRELANIGSWLRSQLNLSIETHRIQVLAAHTVVDDIELALHEICNNVIDHAYGHERGQIKLCFQFDESVNGVFIDVYDSGRQCNISEIKSPDLSQPQIGGYGLFLAQQLVDEVHYTRLSDSFSHEFSNHWRLIRYLR